MVHDHHAKLLATKFAYNLKHLKGQIVPKFGVNISWKSSIFVLKDSRFGLGIGPNLEDKLLV